MAQQVFYTFGAIFFILLSILLVVAIFAAIYVGSEIKRLSRKIHFTMQMFNGILEDGLGYLRTAELGLAGTFLKNLLRFIKRD